MKQALKRIEETLNQLEQLKHTASSEPSTTKNRPFSFEIFLTPPTSDSVQKQLNDSPTQTPAANKVLELPNFITESDSNNAQPVVESEREIDSTTQMSVEIAAPELPNLNTESDSNVQPVVESDREINSSLETQTDVADDETKLEQILHQIQDLYNEGPIVDGWLEYYPPVPEPRGESLREISFERPIENAETVSSSKVGEEIGESPGASYLLCGLDESGQQWSYPCPLDQLPSVSIAIARYHKLQQLLQQKYDLEIRLKLEQGRLLGDGEAGEAGVAGGEKPLTTNH